MASPLPITSTFSPCTSHTGRWAKRRLPTFEARVAPSPALEACHKEIGMPEPQPKDTRGTIESILADTQFMKADEQFRRSFMQTSFYNEVYEKKMATSLEASAIIGNLYTASMYMGLRSMLEFEFKKGTELEGSRIGFGSYAGTARCLQRRDTARVQRSEQLNLEEDSGPRQALKGRVQILHRKRAFIRRKRPQRVVRKAGWHHCRQGRLPRIQLRQLKVAYILADYHECARGASM